MPEPITIHHPSGRTRRVTRRQYHAIWKPKGWRYTKFSSPETSVDNPTGDEPDTEQGDET
jgi:hypothetical protein